MLRGDEMDPRIALQSWGLKAPIGDKRIVLGRQNERRYVDAFQEMSRARPFVIVGGPLISPVRSRIAFVKLAKRPDSCQRREIKLSGK